jgi:hypothetical protein
VRRNSPAIHEFLAEMAKSAQNFAGQPFFELFGEVFSNVTLRLVSRNPSDRAGFRLVNAPILMVGRKPLERLWQPRLTCCADDIAHSLPTGPGRQEWRCEERNQWLGTISVFLMLVRGNRRL